MYNTRVNLNGNYVLWVIMMYQHRFIDCNTWSTLVGCVNEGESIWEISVPSVQFCYESVTALKYKDY